ncbi:MAG: Gfo/Idh/MocA family oxidoreductase [Pseudomonadota bacterium]
MTDLVRWGVVSTGRIAHQFARDFQFIDDGEIVAATSRTKANAQAFADAYDVQRVHDSVADLVDDPQVDAVYIATPHTRHLEDARAALAVGKAVLCEKPLVINPEECRELIAAANASSGYLMEAMWTWFLPAIRQAKAWVDAGRIGRVVQIKADFGYPQRPYAPDRREYDASLGGGCLLEMGIYPVALLQLFLGRQAAAMQVVSKHAPNGVEDDFSAVLDYGDVVGTIGSSYRCKLQNWACVIGEDGYVAIPDFWRATECTLFELDTPVKRFVDDRRSSGLDFETRAVMEDLRAGRSESPIVPLAASLAFQETMASLRARFTPS